MPADQLRNTPPVCFLTLSTIRPASASKSSSVSVFSTGWIDTSMAIDFLSAPIDGSFEDVEHRDAGNQLLVGRKGRAGQPRRPRPPCRRRRRNRASPSGRPTVRASAWSASAWPSAPARRRRRPRSRRAGRTRRAPPASSGGTRRSAEHRLGAELDHAGAARVIPCRTARLDLQPVDRRAQASSAAIASALASNTPTGSALPAQLPARTLRASRCRAARRLQLAAAAQACRLDMRRTLRTARRRRCPCRRCAVRPRSDRPAATAACQTCRRRSDWRASAPAGRRRTARHAWPG